MRKFAFFVPSFILLLVTLAPAQQIDIAAGGGTLLSPTALTDSVNFQPPAEKNGTYVNINVDVVRAKRRSGLEFETAWRYRQTTYPFNGETYRPFLSAVNVLFQPRVGIRKVGIDLLGGIGIASTRFYGLNASCSSPNVGCVNFTSSNHFMEDLGAGIRYNVWRHFFVRPEVRYYHVQNNQEFNSDNVFRVGVSLGYTIHPN